MNENFEEIKKKFYQKYNLLTILGPTASGKTAFAAYVASKFDAEIIGADSRQVYRGMDIGTGKDLDDYNINGVKVPYHLIDIVDAGKKYNLFEYQRDFFSAYQDILKRDKMPVMCGGTGLYIEAIIGNFRLVEVPENKELRKQLEKKSLDELAEMLSSMKKLHNVTEIDTKKRAIRNIEIEIYLKNHPEKRPAYPEIKSLNIGVKFDRKSQKEKITKRLYQRIDEGMIDEVETLLKKGIPAETLIYYGLEYKFLTLYLQGKISKQEMIDKLEIAIHQFSKRQMTFFRHLQKKVHKIFLIDGNLPIEEKFQRILDIIEKERESNN